MYVYIYIYTHIYPFLFSLENSDSLVVALKVVSDILQSAIILQGPHSRLKILDWSSAPSSLPCQIFSQNLGKMAVKKLQGVFLPKFWATLVRELVSKAFFWPHSTPPFPPIFPFFPLISPLFLPFCSPFFSPRPSFAHLSHPPLPPVFSPFLFSTFPLL